MVFASSLGHAGYFMLSAGAACRDWPCWNHAVDLCHQATDEEDEEEEEEAEAESNDSESGDDDEDDVSPMRMELPPLPLQLQQQEEERGTCELLAINKQRRRRRRRRRRGCSLCWRRMGIRRRQKVVVAIVVLICVLTAAFAVLIWVGVGNNPIDSYAVARVHADFFACVMLFLGGGLAIYGLLLFSKMSRLRSGKSSADLSKVAWLAVVCLVCFSARAFLVLAKNLPVDLGVTFADSFGNFLPSWYLFYYIIGEAIPSVVVLIILKDMPPKSRESSVAGGTNYATLPLVDDASLSLSLCLAQAAVLPQWVVPLEGTPYSVVPAPATATASSSSSGGTREPRVKRDSPG
eukprot:jgi/Mesen1/2527/ME000161S01580